jgi:hypothetical protein
MGRKNEATNQQLSYGGQCHHAVPLQIAAPPLRVTYRRGHFCRPSPPEPDNCRRLAGAFYVEVCAHCRLHGMWGIILLNSRTDKN